MLKKSRSAETIALLLVLALAAYVRLANLADNPGWYTDEGTHLDVAQNLLRGRTQYLAIGQSTLLFAKLPLFEALLAGLLGATGGGIGVLRAFTGTLGVLSVGTLYLVVRRTRAGEGRSLALLSALLLAIYPQAVLYSRFGFSYNLLAPLVLLTYLGLWEYLGGRGPADARRGWLALAACAIGVGALSDLWMFSLAAPLLLVVSARRWRDLAWSVPLLLLPFGVYAIVMLANAPQAFCFDVRFTLSRLGALPPLAQVKTLALNYTVLVSQDFWIALGIVGLFLLRPARLQRLSLLLFLLPIVVLGRTAALYSLSSYYVIPLLPFVSLGMAVVVERGVRYAARAVSGGLLALFAGWGWRPQRPTGRRLRDTSVAVGANLIVSLLLATPFLTSTLATVGQVRGRFSTQIDPFLIDPAHARQTAEFVNARVDPDDVVIASPGLAWLLRANAADFQMAVAATGRETAMLPGDVPVERFAFDPRYTRARFVVVDNLWRNWAVWDIAGVAEMLDQVEGWPLVFQAGEIRVYANPDLAFQ
jgi:4-amino-4-deoxy-L-arabinose transferase-like glycosyltransferase